jgi:hypothetical protein
MSHVSACVTRCDFDGKIKKIKCQLKKFLTLGLFSEVIISDIYTSLYIYVWKFNSRVLDFLAVNLFLFLFSVEVRFSQRKFFQKYIYIYVWKFNSREFDFLAVNLFLFLFSVEAGFV